MKKGYSLIALFLAILCLFTTAAQVVSAAELAMSSSESAPFDFSSEDDYMLQAVLSPADLLTRVLEAQYQNEAALSIAEREYLDRYFSDYLVYDEILPPTLLSTEKSGDTVTVTAKTYSFAASNGNTITYLPIRAQWGSASLALSSTEDPESFSATFSAPAEGDLSAITVFYQGSVKLPKEKINQLLTMAYRDAETAIQTNESIAQYTEVLEEYQKYLLAMEQYEEDCLNYDVYLSALERYQNAVVKYEKNLEAWRIYHEKNDLYQAYLKELELYQTKQAQYELDYAEYLKREEQQKTYTVNLNKIRNSLYAMESLFLKPDDNKTGTLYNALQNAELVVMFEKYQDVLSKTFGIKKKTITDLRADADYLNDLLGQYNDARAISEEAAFAFYKEKYGEISFLFNSLYQRMSEILQPNVYNLMCAKLEVEYPEDNGAYKKWRIKNVLAHIYLISLCLDDTKKPDNTWTFYNDRGDKHTYYFSSLLSQNLVISDTNAADPSKLSWLPEVTPMAQPSMPTKPIEVQKPLPPPSLVRPTPPPEVKKPIEPTRVEEPTPPSEEDHTLLERTKDICLAYWEGSLSDRTPLTEDPIITLPELSVQKRIDGPSVFGARGRLLDCDPQNRPEPSEDPNSDLPRSFETEFATYRFVGWSDDTPSRLLRSSENNDLIYAKYLRESKTFDVQFEVDGVLYTQEVAAGEIPVFEGSTKKASSETKDYVFTTWNPPLVPAFSDTKEPYVAQYQEKTRTYAITFAIKDQSTTKRYEWQQMPTPPITPTSYYTGVTLYEFDGWDSPISPVAADKTYTARFRELVLAEIPNGADGTLSVASSDTEYVLVSSHRRIVIAELIAKAAADEKQLEILFSEDAFSVSLDLDAVKALHRQGIHELALAQNETYGTAIRCFQENGTELFLNDGELRLTMEHPLASQKNIYLSAYYPSLDNYQWSVSYSSLDQTAQWIAKTGIYYNLYRRFTLTLNAGEHGQVLANASLYSPGETIQLTVRPDSNYQLSSLTLTDPISGTVLTVDPKNAIMPAWDAVLTAEFSPVEYTITFVYNDQSTTQKQPYGDKVVFPEIPLSFEKDGLFYTFIGWSSTESVVTGDITYVANYYSIPIEEVADSGEGGAWEAVTVNYIIPLAIIGIFLLSILIFVPIVIVKSVKQKKKTTPPPTK